MTPEETQALALAQWLDANQGTDPPADVDSDALEAVFALRPDLAPAPSVSVDQILAGVSAGPLVAPAAQPLTHTAPAPPPANDPQPRGWLPWALGGASALAAAAIALIVVVPAMLSPGSGGLNADVAAMSPAEESPEPAQFRKAEADRPGEGNAAAPASRAQPAEQRERMQVPSGAASDLIVDEKVAQEPPRDMVPPAPVVAVDTTSTSPSVGRRGTGQAQETSTEIGGVIAPDEDAVADLGEDQLLERVSEFDIEDLESDESAPTRTTTDRPTAGQVAGGEMSGGSPPADGLESAEEELSAARSTGRAEEVESLSKRPRSPSKSKEAKAEGRFDDSEPDRATNTSTLERQARPSGPVAAETEAVTGLISAGKLADARDSAQRMLDAGGLNDGRRADLYWALGKALMGLGKDNQARTAFRRAVELRK